jgi:hypothetical protein
MVTVVLKARILRCRCLDTITLMDMVDHMWIGASPLSVGFPSYDWWWPSQSHQPDAEARMDVATDVPWSQKRPVLLFRGTLNSWDGMRIAALWASLQHPEYVDAKLVKLRPGNCEQFLGTTEVWGQQRPEMNFTENCLDIVGKLMRPQDFAGY